jgi:hypothetical protein
MIAAAPQRSGRLATPPSAPHVDQCVSSMENAMNSRVAWAIAAGLALSQFAVPASAETAETPFRTVQQQAFSVEDLQRYGLDEAAAARGVALQEQGYQIVALTPEEAEAYHAGAITQTEWILIGIGVLIILAIA